MARHEESVWTPPQVRVRWLRCEHEPCSRIWQRPDRSGPVPKFCSDACKQANHRAVRKLSKTARSAHAARQDQRRQQWQATADLLEQEAAAERVQGGAQHAPVPAATTERLQALAGEVARLRERGPVSTEAATGLHREFLELQAEADTQHAHLSEGLEDLEAALALVRLQLGIVLAGMDDD